MNTTTFGISTTTIETGVDSYFEKQLADWILSYGFLILLLFGTASNIISLVVLRCKSFRTTSVSLSLSILSVVYLGVLFVPVLRNWIKGTFDIKVRVTSVGCKLHVFLTYFFCHLSSWTLTLIVLERALIICFPLWVKPYISRKNWLIIWGITTSLIACLNLHFFFTFDYMPDPTKYSVKEEEILDLKNLTTLSSLLISKSSSEKIEYEMECFRYERYGYFFSFVWPWIDNIVLTILPFLLIFSGNLAILIVIRKAMKFSLASSSRGGSHKDKDNLNRSVSRRNSGEGHHKGNPTSSTLMLFGSSIVFILLTLPSGIYFIISDTLFEHDHSDHKMAIYWLAYACTNFLFYLSYSVNFLVYYLTGSKFRKSFKECFSTHFFTTEHPTNENQTLTTKI